MILKNLNSKAPPTDRPNGDGGNGISRTPRKHRRGGRVDPIGGYDTTR